MTGWRDISHIVEKRCGDAIWVLSVCGAEITVSDCHPSTPGRWVMYCHWITHGDGPCILCRDLGAVQTTTVDEAKARAIREAAFAARDLLGAAHPLTIVLVAHLPSVWARIRAEPWSALVLAAFLFALVGWAITFALSGPGVW
ncbi:hypothetical protein DSD19_06085 [Rhodovulum sp. BSW8]|uniref:hypothetical protein n=1 Tax=Rhodovulum sp. BSW8 TaxID=2259645 RepID=UPI000DE47CB1|nr:hypothetical protein [Rhodovulum sp. BSW8]RBO54030.1 hypothetical protein DSD19_06085 [Rhodovulum sp. BSW8]